MNTKYQTEKFYNIAKIDVNDPVGMVTVKTHDKDYVQVDQTVKYATEEQINQLAISNTSENGTLTIKAMYPELNIEKIGVTNNFYFGTRVTRSDTDPYPEISHIIWLPKGQTIEQTIIDINTLTDKL